MQVVIFEVVIKEGKQQEYLDIAATLRPILEKIDGFISVERFQSLNTPEKLLSVSFWRDATALTEWREQHAHLKAQEKGRDELFDSFCITVAESLRSYGREASRDK
jgi:heme-degrading monooxygenase HmoA